MPPPPSVIAVNVSIYYLVSLCKNDRPLSLLLQQPPSDRSTDEEDEDEVSVEIVEVSSFINTNNCVPYYIFRSLRLRRLHRRKLLNSTFLLLHRLLLVRQLLFKLRGLLLLLLHRGSRRQQNHLKSHLLYSKFDQLHLHSSLSNNCLLRYGTRSCTNL